MYIRRYVICFLVFFCSIPVLGYFEERYRCTVTQQSITVQMNGGDQKCFSYLSQINDQISLINKDIAQAQNYILRGTDVDYRTLIFEKLNRQKIGFETARDQALLAIDDFERSLFSQVKNLLKFHLSTDKKKTLSDIKTTRKMLEDSLKTGDDLLYGQGLSDMEMLQYKLFLLDRIEFSHDFEELVPFLKEYLYGRSNEQ